jgi:hypothetical protein
LQTFRVQPPDAAKHLVEKTGFGRWHWKKSRLQRDNLTQPKGLSNQKWALMAQWKFKTGRDAVSASQKSFFNF